MRAIDIIIFTSSGQRLAKLCPALTPPQLVVVAGDNFLIKEELRYDKPAMQAKARDNLAMIDTAQRAATTSILTAVDSPATEVITVHGSSKIVGDGLRIRASRYQSTSTQRRRASALTSTPIFLEHYFTSQITRTQAAPPSCSV